MAFELATTGSTNASDVLSDVSDSANQKSVNAGNMLFNGENQHNFKNEDILENEEIAENEEIVENEEISEVKN
jgi:hypothetical protein